MPRKPRSDSLVEAAKQIVALEQASAMPVVPPRAVQAALRVDQALPAKARLQAEAEAVEQNGGGYERVVEMSRTIVEAGLSFASIGPETMEPPQEWVAVLGPDAALRAFRLAKAAWLPSREAPAGLSIATDILKMDARVKAAKKGGSAPPLNVAIQVVMQPVAYPELEVDE